MPHMKTFLTVSMLLAVLAASASPFATAPAALASTDDDKRAVDEVRRLCAEEVDAFLHKDAKTMERLWSDAFVVTNPLNTFANKQQVLGMMESGVLIIVSYDRQTEYARAYHDDTVIVAGSETVIWGGRMPNAGKTEHLRFTAVWMREHGTWQEVARHANIVPEAR